ncbi:MAG: exopolysaccharide biosynthesis protein [Acidimicrobiia bacterium]
MTQRPFSEDLETWLRSDQPKSLGALADAFEEKSFAVAALLLLSLSALPIPTGVLTWVFEGLALVVATEMMLGRETLWIPVRLRHKTLSERITEKAIPFLIRRVRWFERYSNRRLSRVFGQGWFTRVLGAVIFLFTLGAMVAPPFSGLDTLPSLGVVIVALGIILEDLVVLVVGIVVGTGGIVLILALFGAIVRFFQGLS